MQLAGLTAKDLEANLREAKSRAAAALKAYEAAKQEVAWLHQGLSLIDPEAAAAIEEEGEDPAAMVAELFPNGLVFSGGRTPTLRQAIVLVMRDNAYIDSWNPPLIAKALEQRGWLPAREDARKRISDMAGIMYESGQLARVGRGVYRLSPPLAAALDAAGGNQE